MVFRWKQERDLANIFGVQIDIGNSTSRKLSFLGNHLATKYLMATNSSTHLSRLKKIALVDLAVVLVVALVISLAEQSLTTTNPLCLRFHKQDMRRPTSGSRFTAW